MSTKLFSLLLFIGLISGQALPATELTDAQVLAYVRSLNECYDVDGNRSLNETELMGLVRGTLNGHQKCPAQKIEDDDMLNSQNLL